MFIFLNKKNIKALAYHGPEKREWEQKPKPIIKNSKDAIDRRRKAQMSRTYHFPINF